MPMETIIFTLDLIGVYAFSVFGSYIALRKKFDLFGIFCCAFLNALGGGTVREIILGNLPVYFSEYIYIYIVILGTITSIILYSKFKHYFKIFLFIDALGLSTFAYIGAVTADNNDLGGFAVVFFATITAIGGGILRDIVLRRTPDVFQKDFYATPAIILGSFYVFLKGYMDDIVMIVLLIIFTFLIRLLAIQWKLKLWSK